MGQLAVVTCVLVERDPIKPLMCISRSSRNFTAIGDVSMRRARIKRVCVQSRVPLVVAATFLQPLYQSFPAQSHEIDPLRRQEEHTCRIRVVASNIGEVERQGQLCVLPGWQSFVAQISMSNLTVGIQVIDLGIHMTECQRKEVAAGVHLKVSKGWEGEIGRCAIEVSIDFLRPVARGVG